jgi:hypothetical protein
VNSIAILLAWFTTREITVPDAAGAFRQAKGALVVTFAGKQADVDGFGDR